MKSAPLITLLIALAPCAYLSGCASIVSGRRADVAIGSYPSNAHVVVHDHRGQAVASLNTPGFVTLKRNRRFFLPARYTATIEAPGYQPARVPIRSTVNPWILGNVVIGGIPGLIVDNATGAAWQPRESQIHRQLSPLYGPEQDALYSANVPPQHGAAEAAHDVADRSEQAAARNGRRKATPASTSSNP